LEPLKDGRGELVSSGVDSPFQKID
jgi:hypothetical protein